MTPAVRVEGLAKRYGAVRAVDGVDFVVERGEVFGLVGPNGAGKTTTIECMAGLRRPSDGAVRVLDLDPHRDRAALNERIGIQLQHGVLQARVKVWEAIDLYASFYANPLDWTTLLEPLGLADKRDRLFSQLSGGEKQRLFVALAMVGDPEVLFLDEMTTGLDPHARRAMWTLLESARDEGKTVILSSHFMEEAERLCDRVGIMDRGKLVALESPDALVREFGSTYAAEFLPLSPFEPEWAEELGLTVTNGLRGGRVRVSGSQPEVPIRVLELLQARSCSFERFATLQPTLEDVFLELTGRSMETADEEAVS
jgi:ABC-2 type transport system ATP-binding protein